MNKVDEYFQKQPSPQKEILLSLRKLIFQTFPKIKEEFKLGVPVYDDKYYLVGLKDHVNFGFSIIGMNEDEISLFDGGGKTTKHVQIANTAQIEKDRLVKLMKMVKEPYT